MDSDQTTPKPIAVAGLRLIVASVAIGLVLPSLAEAAKLSATGGDGSIQLAGVVPVPPGKPGRKPPPTSIGQLISAAEDDAGGAPAAEDSDIPLTSAPPAMAPASSILEKPGD